MRKTYNSCGGLAPQLIQKLSKPIVKVDAAKTLKKAVQWHQAGHLAQAESLYRQVLQANPDHSVALHSLGLIAHQTGHNEAAADLVSQAISNNPKIPHFYNTLSAVFAALGKLDKAVKACQKAVAIKPDYAEAHSNLGVLLHLQGRHKAAIKSANRATSLNPNDIKAFNTIAAAMQAQDRHTEAIRYYKQVIQLNPNFAAAYNNLGNILRQQGDFDQAILNYKKAIKLEPNNPNAYNNLGNVLKTQGLYADAIENYEKALQLQPDSAVIFNNLGLTQSEIKLYDEAIQSLSQAIKLAPNYAEAHDNLGNTLKEMGQYEEAIKSCSRAIQLNPNYAAGYNNIGTCFYEQDKFYEASENFKRAIQLKPDFAEPYHNLGAVFFRLGQYNEAIENCEHAVKLKPDYAEAYNSLGGILHNQRQYDKAITNFSKAVEVRPDYARAYVNRAYSFLITGDFAQGWKDYWWRRKIKDEHMTFYRRRFEVPLWDGSSFANKRLLIHYEQGAGDNIQFVRYMPLVKSRGGTVIFEIPKAVSGLLNGFDGIDELIETPLDGKLPDVEFDYYVPLMDLPGIFETTLETIPADIPYLYADPAKVTYWKKKLSDDKFKVGIVWAGSPKHKNDHCRSCPLRHFAPLAKIRGVQLYGLQKGPATAQIDDLADEMSVVNLGEDFKDFSDTAAAIENMDLIISVDTSVLHLAGAMGKPTWGLISYVLDWRWLLEREDSPWYKTVRLFRQKKLGDWEDVLNSVATKLRLFV